MDWEQHEEPPPRAPEGTGPCPTYKGWARAQLHLDTCYPPRSDFASRPCTNVPRAPGCVDSLTEEEAVVAKSIMRLNVAEGTALAKVFSSHDPPLAFRTRRDLLQLLDTAGSLHDMAMLDVRPALLAHVPGIQPLFPRAKTEVAVCTNTEGRLRCDPTLIKMTGVHMKCTPCVRFYIYCRM